MDRRRPASDTGAAAVEFALISVVLLTLLLGIVQYGFFFFQASSMSQAASQGARQAAVGIDSCEDWRDDVTGTVPAVENSIVGVEASPVQQRGDDLTVTVSWEPVAFGVVPLPSGPQEQSVRVRAERLGTASAAGCS